MRNAGSTHVFGMLVVACAWFMSSPTLAAESPASFMNQPLVTRGVVSDPPRSVREFISGFPPGREWKRFDDGAWRLTIREVDRVTDKKREMIILLAPGQGGIALQRVVLNGQEFNNEQRMRFVDHAVSLRKK